MHAVVGVEGVSDSRFAGVSVEIWDGLRSTCGFLRLGRLDPLPTWTCSHLSKSHTGVRKALDGAGSMHRRDVGQQALTPTEQWREAPQRACEQGCVLVSSQKNEEPRREFFIFLSQSQVHDTEGDPTRRPDTNKTHTTHVDGAFCGKEVPVRRVGAGSSLH